MKPNNIGVFNLFCCMTIVELSGLLVSCGASQFLYLPLQPTELPTIMPESIPLSRPLTIERQDIIKDTVRAPKNLLLLEWIAVEAWVRRHAERPVKGNAHTSADLLRSFDDNLRREEVQRPELIIRSKAAPCISTRATRVKGERIKWNCGTVLCSCHTV